VNDLSNKMTEINQIVKNLQQWAGDTDDRLTALGINATDCHCDHVTKVIEDTRVQFDGIKGLTMHIQETIKPDIKAMQDEVKKHDEALRGIIGDAWLPSMVATVCGSVGLNGNPGPAFSNFMGNTFNTAQTPSMAPGNSNMSGVAGIPINGQNT
jgi:hypothetical protein